MHERPIGARFSEIGKHLCLYSRKSGERFSERTTGLMTPQHEGASC